MGEADRGGPHARRSDAGRRVGGFRAEREPAEAPGEHGRLLLGFWGPAGDGVAHGRAGLGGLLLDRCQFLGVGHLGVLRGRHLLRFAVVLEEEVSQGVLGHVQQSGHRGHRVPGAQPGDGRAERGGHQGRRDVRAGPALLVPLPPLAVEGGAVPVRLHRVVDLAPAGRVLLHRPLGRLARRLLDRGLAPVGVLALVRAAYDRVAPGALVPGLVAGAALDQAVDGGLDRVVGSVRSDFGNDLDQFRAARALLLLPVPEERGPFLGGAVEPGLLDLCLLLLPGDDAGGAQPRLPLPALLVDLGALAHLGAAGTARGHDVHRPGH
ncbi:hypothetical protein EES44_16195 [Streptomyces sp. ADI96-15]|nr:hypothetical protein EES44_16195 [Streptomyces sp. ADI96-15]